MQKSKLINLFIYSYIALPFLIFASGFLKWYFALPISLCIILSVILAVKSSEGLKAPAFSVHSLPRFCGGIILIVLIVLLSGIGNVMWQNNDHATRNTLFNILVEYSWPPKYITDGGNEVGIVYYIGFWLPSALLGKITSLGWGYFFQILWAIAGLGVLWYLLCVIHKKIVVYPLVIFLFFSGMDIMGHGLVSTLYDKLTTLQTGTWAFPQGSPLTTHIEWWGSYYQYSSHITQLFWVFNQCIPVWIATVLILIEKNNKNLVFIMGLTLISSTLPFIGLIPVFVWCAVCDHNGSLLDRPFTSNIKESFLSLFTWQNVVGGGISGIMSFLYLVGNIASGTSGASSGTAQAAARSFSISNFLFVLIAWAACFLIANINKIKKLSVLLYLTPALPLALLMAKTTGSRLELYLLFIVFEFIILAFLLLPACGKSGLFFITVSCLLLIPFFTVGKSIDFCMRASIPLLVVLCLFSISALNKYFAENRQILATLLCIVLMLGAITPVKEIVRTIEATAYEIQTKGSVQNDSKTQHQVFGGRNFIGKTEGNIFFEIFSK